MLFRSPALYGNLVIWPTKPGKVYGVDRATGEIKWTIKVSGPVLSSPVVVDDSLVLGDGAGILRSWSLASGEPKLQWEVSLSANIEASPAVWNGRIYVGSRSGFFYAVGNE